MTVDDCASAKNLGICAQVECSSVEKVLNRWADDP
jgi:hypothetical protein